MTKRILLLVFFLCGGLANFCGQAAATNGKPSIIFSLLDDLDWLDDLA